MKNIEIKSYAKSAHGEMTTPRVRQGMGKRIYDWRIKNEVPLYQLHKDSGVAYSLLFKLETEEGSSIHNIKTAVKLSKTMGVNPAWLYGWTKGEKDGVY